MKKAILLLFALSCVAVFGQYKKKAGDKTFPEKSLAFSRLILSDPAIRKSLNENMNTVHFVPNDGQYAKEILYTFKTPQAQLLIFKNKIRLISIKNKLTPIRFKNKNSFPETDDKQYIDIFFPGANQLQPEAIVNKQPTTYNYFSGEKNVTNVKAASEIRLNNIYNGITLRLYSNKSGSLEFDWLVANAEDYSKIKMQFLGQNFLKVDDNGDLELGLRFGSLKLKIPETYQVNENGKRIPFQSRFILSSANEAGYFLKGKLNSKLPLIIDPVLQWGAYMEGNNVNFDAYLFGGVKDANNDIYVCGATQRITTTDIQTVAYGNPVSGYIATPPSGSGTGVTGANGDGVDWMIMKIKSDGSAVLTYTFFGLSSTDLTKEQAHCISISPNGGSVFVGGICNSDVPLSLPALSAGYTGNTAFGGTSTTTSAVPTIAVFTADLASLKYRTFIGDGTRQGDVCSIEALNDNDYVVASYVNGPLGNGTGAVAYANGPDNNWANGYDIYIAKFINLKTRSWGTYVGGDGNDEVFDMRLLSNNDVAFCGSASSTNPSLTYLVNEVASTANRGNSIISQDALVGVIKADGSAFNMLSKVGGSGTEEFDGIQPGPCDTLFLTGTTSSSDFPNIGSGVIQTSYGGGSSDMIVFKCPASGGNTGVGTYYGGSALDIGNSIVYIPIGSGKVFIFGTTQSNNASIAVNNVPGNTFFKNTNGGSYDMFFLECSTDFKKIFFATYVGGSNMDYLGDTGAQITGRQMVMLSDSTLGVFTTTHSTVLTPNVISPSGVFDNTKTNGTDDTWTMFVINVKDSYGEIDAGDAPLSYGKATVEIDTSGSNALISLGDRVDDDDYYPTNPGAMADYDDNEGNIYARKPGGNMYYNPGASGPASGNDEDAVSPAAANANKPTYSLTVPYYNNSGEICTIYGYIDFNSDGDFNDANEMVSVTALASNSSAAGSAGRTTTLTWTFPPGMVLGYTYMRLAIVKGAGGPALSGACTNLSNPMNQAYGVGEVEDYLLLISASLVSTDLDFNAVRQDKNIFVYWQMATDENTASFVVERSIDGINFSPVGEVNPLNNKQLNKYSFSDKNYNPAVHVYYYRLKIINKNGNYTFSSIKKVVNENNGFAVTALPAVFHQQLHINISSAFLQNASISLVDVTGKTIYTGKKLLQKGSNDLFIRSSTVIPAGVYFINVVCADQKQALKVIKNRQ